LEEEKVVQSVQNWVESCVVGLNLCPFAKAELIKARVRFSATELKTEEGLLQQLRYELQLLDSDDAIETTLLIHPAVLTNFYDYNQFLSQAENLLVELGMEGVYQIASFHPDYQFAGTQREGAENYTNRSPYPILHILREQSLMRVLENYPNPELIPERNIELLLGLGNNKMKAMLKDCFKTNSENEER
tara:strand:- start:29972 stop:30538 length:567 start_codon:yes stop_codon:yes gene_type:complete